MGAVGRGSLRPPPTFNLGAACRYVRFPAWHAVPHRSHSATDAPDGRECRLAAEPQPGPVDAKPFRQRAVDASADLARVCGLIDDAAPNLRTPTVARPDVHTRNPAASRPPNPGDMVIRRAWDDCARHLARAHQALDRLEWLPGRQPWRSRRVLGVPYPETRTVSHAELHAAATALAGMLAQLAICQMGEQAERIATRACDEAHAALLAWDQAESGETGSMVTPPDHWPGPDGPRRCPRLREGERCGAVLNRREQTCNACRQRDHRARNRAAESETSRNRKRKGR